MVFKLLEKQLNELSSLNAISNATENNKFDMEQKLNFETKDMDPHSKVYIINAPKNSKEVTQNKEKEVEYNKIKFIYSKTDKVSNKIKNIYNLDNTINKLREKEIPNIILKEIDSQTNINLKDIQLIKFDNHQIFIINNKDKLYNYKALKQKNALKLESLGIKTFKSDYNDEFLKDDDAKLETKFKKEEDLKKDSFIYYLINEKTGKYELYKKDELQKLKGNNLTEFKDNLFKIVDLKWDNNNKYYYEVRLENVEKPDEKKVWKDIKPNSQEFESNNIDDDPLIYNYWLPKVLTKNEMLAKEGKIKANRISLAKIDKKALDYKLLNSYRLFKELRYSKVFQDYDQQLIVAKILDNNELDTRPSYTKLWLSPQVMYSNDWKIGLKSMLYVVSDDFKKLLSKPLTEIEIKNIYKAMLDGGKLQNEKSLVHIINNVIRLKQNNEGLTPQNLID